MIDKVVRSIHQICPYNENATGLVISCDDLKTLLKEDFYDEVIKAVEENTCISLIFPDNNAQKHINDRRNDLVLSVSTLSNKSGVDFFTVQEMCNYPSKFQVRMRDVIKVCEVLELDPRIVGLPKDLLK